MNVQKNQTSVTSYMYRRSMPTQASGKPPPDLLVSSLPFQLGLIAANITKLARAVDQLSLTRFLFFDWLRFVDFLFDHLRGDLRGFLRRCLS